jgi:hypothetical protein
MKKFAIWGKIGAKWLKICLFVIILSSKRKIRESQRGFLLKEKENFRNEKKIFVLHI